MSLSDLRTASSSGTDEEVTDRLPSHSSIESAPQWPTIPGVYYACGAIEPEANGRMDDLIDVVYFDDDLDLCFAKAAFLTPFLEVYSEKPPGYVTSPEGQGAGKAQSWS